MYDYLLNNYHVIFEGFSEPIFYKYFYPIGNNYGSLWDLFSYARGLKKDRSTDCEKFEQYAHFEEPNTHNIINLYERDFRDFLNSVYQDNELPKKGGIATIPSSDARKVNRVTEIVRSVLKSTPGIYVDLTWNIHRTKSKETAHGSGDRSVARNIETLGVRNPHELVDLDLIIVVDDIVTTGSSFRGMSDYLRSKGFEGTIINFAFARTFASDVVSMYLRYSLNANYKYFPVKQEFEKTWPQKHSNQRDSEPILGMIYDLDQTLLEDPIRDWRFEERLGNHDDRFPYRVYEGVWSLMKLDIPSVVVSNRSNWQLEHLFRYSVICNSIRLSTNSKTRIIDHVFSYPTSESDSGFKNNYYKPHPGGVENAISYLRNKCDIAEGRIVGLGNTLEDMIAYRASGIDSALALWGIPDDFKEYARKNWRAEYVFESVGDFKSWLEDRMIKDYFEKARRLEKDNLIQAIDYYRKAIDTDDNAIESAFRIAFLLEDIDPEEAKRYYEIAIQLGDEYAATNNLALMIQNQDLPKAIELFERSIAAGNNKNGPWNLALAIQKEDPDRAVDLIELCAESLNGVSIEKQLTLLVKDGNLRAADAYFRLVLDSDESQLNDLANLVVEFAPNKAREFYERAICAGDEYYAARNLANLLKESEPETALRLYKVAANAGNDENLINDLESLIRKGNKTAIQMFEEHFVSKDGDNAVTLANLLREVDAVKARELYELAIQGGDEKYATYQLAYLIMDSEVEQAKELFKRSLEAGNIPSAANALGLMFRDDDRDYAIELYEKAIEYGDEYYAPKNLARVLIDDDPERAYNLMKCAIDAGNTADNAELLKQLILQGIRPAIDLYETTIVSEEETKANELANLIKEYDPKRAEQLYIRAINAGDEHYATYNLAMLIGEENPTYTISLLERAIEAGDFEYAPVELGVIVAKNDIARAEELFKLCIDKSEGRCAACNLAHMYIIKHPNEAQQLYSKAITFAEGDAYFGLAYLLREKDPVRSKELIELARNIENQEYYLSFFLEFLSYASKNEALKAAKFYISQGFAIAEEALIAINYGGSFTQKNSRVFFGEQNGSSIEWIILSRSENELFVISAYLLGREPYLNGADNAIWESSSLRDWLNKEFIETVFSADDLSCLSKHYDDDAYVSCLSEAELVEYQDEFPELSKCAPVRSRFDESWWLKNGDPKTTSARCVTETGDVAWYMAFLNLGIRPTLRLKL